MRGSLLLLLAAMAFPSAAAQIATPILKATYEVEGRSCQTEVQECFARVDLGSQEPGDESIDASQEIEAAGVALQGTDGGPIPGKAVTVDPSRAYVEHPLFALVTETWNSGERRSPSPETADVAFDPEAVRVYYPGPVSGERQEYGFGYRDDGIGYRHLGPYNDLGGNSTDNYLVHAGLVCKAAGPCPEWYDAAREDVVAATPEVKVGFSVRNLTLSMGHVGMESRSGGDQAQGSRSLRRLEIPPPLARFPPGKDDALGFSSPASTPLNPDSTPEGQRFTIRHDGPGRPGAAPYARLPWHVAGGALVGLAILVLALYARITGRKRVLESRTRQGILSEVAARPGIRLSELGARLNLKPTTIEHHLRVLHREGLLRVQRLPGRVTAWPIGSPPPPGTSLDQHPACARMMDALRAAPEGLPRASLHALLPEVPTRTRNHLVKRLLDAGRVTSIVAGTEDRIVLVPPAR